MMVFSMLRSPVADFSQIFKFRDLENGVIIAVVHKDGLLVLGEELRVLRGSYVVVRLVYES